MGVKKRLMASALPATLAALIGTWRKGQAVPAPLKEHAIHLRLSGTGTSTVARLIGVSPEAVRLWVSGARVNGAPAVANPAPATPVPPPPAASIPPGTCSGSTPPQVRDDANGLSQVEVDAILDLKKEHFSMGPAQIRAQLKRFKGWRVSVRAIARALRDAGYETVHQGSRPKDEVIHRFEAPHRNALWQMDFVELRVGPERVHLLLILDDFSRFVVGWAVLADPTSEAVVGVLKDAIRRHGKPESVYTDRGGAFLAWRHPSDLDRFLEAELIDHHVSASYRPQGRGKIEALAGTVQRELWNLVQFQSTSQAKDSLKAFFLNYNHARAHMGIDGLTPADRFFGRWEEVKARVDALSRRRQGALPVANGGHITEEVSPDGGPAEVLRLLLVDGRLEVRFLGHRVDLGAVQA